MLKKFPSDKINGTKKALFFFCELQLITVLLLICDFYMSLSARFVSVKLCVGFSFSITLYFWSSKSMYFLNLKRHNSFQNQDNRKSTHSFAPRPLIFKLQQEVLKFIDICVSCSWPSDKFFKPRKLMFWERLNSNF